MNSCLSIEHRPTFTGQYTLSNRNRHFFSVVIPVKSYVKKYVEARYPQPMKITLKNYLGAVIYSYITTSKQTTKKSDYHTAVRYKLLTDNIRILIPCLQVNKGSIGLGIPVEKAVLLNNLFEEKIAEDLHTYCITYSQCGKPQRQAIEDFCEHHNIDIEIDITYGALRKSQYRHKKELHKPTSLSWDA